MIKTIPIFIGYDHRERAAANILIDSLYQNSSYPISLTPIVTEQLVKNGFHSRLRDEKQSTSFSFTRFLVPYLMGYEGWAIFWIAIFFAEVIFTNYGNLEMINMQ